MKRKTASSISSQKSSLDKYVKEILMLIIGWAAENKDAIIKDFSHLIRFKKIFERYVVLSIMIIIAAILMLNGIIVFIESLFILPPGLAYIAIGIILMVIALVCKKLWKI